MICEPDIRYTAQQVLNHKWVTQLAPNAKESLLSINVENLKNYTKQNKLKKAVLTFIASRLGENDVKVLKEIFQNLDSNKDGTLTLDEIKKGIEQLKNPDFKVDINALFKSMDTDHSGRIDYTEFLAACMDKSIYLREERLLEAFKMMDIDSSGKISKEEIKKSLKLDNVDESTLDKYIKQYDLNGDGEIDYNEFLNMMTNI
jgi:calcium-dependent protein kinase